MTNRLDDQPVKISAEIARKFISVLDKTNIEKPTQADRKELDKMLHECPALWVLTGDLMDHAIEKIFERVGETYALKATLKTGWNETIVGMTHPDDGLLEKMLVKQAALCWMQLGYVELQYNTVLTDNNTTLSRADFWERRLNSAQKRYLRATETLARVRRLRLPTMQVNIAAQQVNQVNQNG